MIFPLIGDTTGIVFNQDGSFSGVGTALQPLFDKIYNFAVSLFGAVFVDILPKIIIAVLVIALVMYLFNLIRHRK